MNHFQIRNSIRCERCKKLLQNPKNIVYLELSCNDGNYYFILPPGHESQGGFPFGKDCASRIIKETTNELAWEDIFNAVIPSRDKFTQEIGIIKIK